MPRRLGLIYCQQRPSKLYASPVTKLLQQLAVPTEIDAKVGKKNNQDSTLSNAGEKVDLGDEKDGACYCLTLETRLARSPLFSPVSDDGKTKLF